MKRQRIEGMLHRSLPAQLTLREKSPDEADDGLLRLQLSVSSDTPYLRASYWDEPWVEVLGHKEGEIDMARLNDGAPVLANHSRYDSIGATPLAAIGAVERAWLDDGKLLVDMAISRREALADLRQDIADGLVRNVSIGYQIGERVLTRANGEGKPDEYRVTSWTPFEVSLVDIPADATVGLGRSEESTAPRYRVVDLPATGSNLLKGDSMQQATTAAAENTTATPPAATEQTRSAPPPAPAGSVAAIREAVRVAGFDTDLALDMIERGLTIDAVRDELFRKMAEKANANPTRSGSSHIETLRDETETRRELMSEAIAHRLDPAAKLSEGAREYRHMSLLRMGEEALAAAGVRVRGLSPLEIATRSMMSTSDFPSILANVANKRLRAAYEAAETTYQRWAYRAPNAPDFKEISILQLGGAPELLQINESGEYKYGTVGEGAEKYKVITYGRIIAFARQAMVNDDLRSFDRLIVGFAQSASRLENRLVYTQLTANAAMADGIALFHASHGNLAAAGAVISATTLGAGRAAMRKQKGLSGEDLNNTPSYLLGPTDLEQVMYQYTSAQFVPAKGTDTNEFRAGGRTALEPIVDPVLDANSTTAWYLVGKNTDTVEYCWLDGAEGVYIESEPGFDVDGMKLKARDDFAAKAADYRAMYKNPGA